MAQVTYKDAGVDLELYEDAMGRLPALMRKTHTPRVMDLVGGFAGLFRLNGDGGSRTRYKDPVLVSGTDGVGTKLKVAIAAKKFDTVGIDLVAMCVNDILCLGAEPLFFLDYLATSKDDPDLIADLVRGVSAGCVEGKLALLGGETAIMPGIYAPGEFDMAGFAVGVVERSRLIDGKEIKPGDRVIGLAASGLHSNGYSLIRKVVFEHAGLSVEQRVENLGKTVGELLLEPTRIYVRPVLDMLGASRRKPPVHGMAHITGGGLADNIERILPENCRVEIDGHAWDVPPAFTWLESLGFIDRGEMLRTFNMGVGFVLIVGARQARDVHARLAASGVAAWTIGSVVEGPRGVDISG